MERLTLDEAIAHAKEVAKEKYNEGFLCHANPDDGKMDECVKCAQEHEQLAEWLTQLKEYQQLEEKGRLIKLPCKIGDDVYFVPSQTNYKLNMLSHHSEENKICHQKVARITFGRNGWYLECDKDLEYATDHILTDNMYKETWFLTQEEAEAKLKELRGGE